MIRGGMSASYGFLFSVFEERQFNRCHGFSEATVPSIDYQSVRKMIPLAEVLQLVGFAACECRRA